MTHIRIEGVSKLYGETVALRDVTLDLAKGSFTALLGPSGCGKTTLLRLIAGFERPTTGQILFDDAVICDASGAVPPERRNVGVVFQSYALWPHLSVFENVAYPLRARGVPRHEIAGRVEEALATVDLSSYGSRSPEALSGGQRQRVALARCIVANAGVIVFDEPLANLDVHLRASMIENIADLHRRTRATIVYVTHDQAEALALADRVAVMKSGQVLQFAEPEEIYVRPATPEVATFVGRGKLIQGVAQLLAGDIAEITCAGHWFQARVSTSKPEVMDGAVTVLLRPEALSLSGSGIAATVRRVTYRGATYEVDVETANNAGILTLDCIKPPEIGAAVFVAVADAWVVPDKV